MPRSKGSPNSSVNSFVHSAGAHNMHILLIIGITVVVAVIVILAKLKAKNNAD
jgi:hypothetical protein